MNLESSDDSSQTKRTNSSTRSRSWIRKCFLLVSILICVAWVVSPWPWSDYGRRASAFEQLGLNRMAVRDYTLDIELREKEGQLALGSRYSRARLHEDSRNYQLAVNDFSALLNQIENYPQYLVTFLCERAENNLHLGRYKSAFKDLNIAKSQKPDDPWVQRLLNKAELHLDRATVR